MLVLTNNPLAAEKLQSDAAHEVRYLDVDLRGLLVAVRDLVHLGHRLLTHPLSGSVKPNETMYKSVGISPKPGNGLCMESLSLIEQAILACDKFSKRERHITPDMQADFQLVDWTLISSALTSN